MFEWLFPKSATARQLHRDAVKIIDTDRQFYADEYLLRAGEIVKSELEKAEKRIAERPKDQAVVRYELERRHREVRRQGDGAALTALTLVLIKLRADALGDVALPATQVIDAFIADPINKTDDIRA